MLKASSFCEQGNFYPYSKQKIFRKVVSLVEILNILRRL